MNKCPCENCICVPTCRNKKYFVLIHQCSLLCSYFGSAPRACTMSPIRNIRLQKLFNVLKPVWMTKESGSSLIVVQKKKPKK